jgi:GDPmannose 4,6-dehydratase
MTRALILGVGGQDGSYLAEHLLSLNYEVHGLYRHSSYDNLKRIAGFHHLLTLHEGDVTDFGSLLNVVARVDPDELYNLADQDHVGWSRKVPEVAWDVTFKGACHAMEAVRQTNCELRMFQPISSTVFGLSKNSQDEDSPIDPRSPYAVAKAAAWIAAKMYRETFGLWIACGILYNHDSPRRSHNYLLHELAEKTLAVKRGQTSEMAVKNAYEVVDIGFAGDFVRAYHTMLHGKQPGDYILSGGNPRTVGEYAREFLRQVGCPDIEVVSEQLEGPRLGMVGNNINSQDDLAFFPKTTPEQLVSMILEAHRWSSAR